VKDLLVVEGKLVVLQQHLEALLVQVDPMVVVQVLTMMINIQVGGIKELMVV
jgi:hypothetical protein